jgi:hypothetical protein
MGQAVWGDKESPMQHSTSTLDALVAQLQQRFGTKAAQRGTALRAPAAATIPTGFIALDRALPNGGIPRGALTELVGTPTAGASTLALSIVAQAQAQGDRACYLDLGGTFAAEYAARCGVQLDTLLLARPATAREAVEIIATLIARHAAGVLVVDSLPHLLAMPHGAQQLAALLRRLRAGAPSSCALLILNPPPCDFLPARSMPAPQVLAGAGALRLRLTHARWIFQQQFLVGCESSAEILPPPFTDASAHVALSVMYPLQGPLL